MKGKSGKRKILLWIGLALFPVVAAAVCLFIGRLSISPKEALETVWNAITGSKETNVVFSTILRLRLPRILTALAVGAGLSIAGASFQSLFVNPLATPDTVGVASGASFGAALGILLHMGTAGTQALSFLSGIAAVTLTVLAGTGKKRNLNSVVLSGISLVFTEVLTYLERAADQCSSIAMLMLARDNDAILKNHHEYLTELHSGRGVEYRREFERNQAKYYVPLEAIEL